MYLLERPFIDCRVINNSHFTLSGAQKIIYSFTQKLSRAAERTHIHLPTNGTDQCMGSASMLIQGGKINKKKWIVSSFHHACPANTFFLFQKMPTSKQFPHEHFQPSEEEYQHVFGPKLSSEHPLCYVKATAGVCGCGHLLRNEPYGQRGWKSMRALVSHQYLAARVSGAVFQVLRCLLDASSETGHSNERQECQIYICHTKQSFLAV